jgi:hypothetical protein
VPAHGPASQLEEWLRKPQAGRMLAGSSSRCVCPACPQLSDPLAQRASGTEQAVHGAVSLLVVCSGGGHSQAAAERGGGEMHGAVWLLVVCSGGVAPCSAGSSSRLRLCTPKLLDLITSQGFVRRSFCRTKTRIICPSFLMHKTRKDMMQDMMQESQMCPSFLVLQSLQKSHRQAQPRNCPARCHRRAWPGLSRVA